MVLQLSSTRSCYPSAAYMAYWTTFYRTKTCTFERKCLKRYVTFIFFHNPQINQIAIPTILTGLATDAGIYRLRGSYLWFQDRLRCPDVYTQFDHFYHAWKFSKFSDPNQANFFCHEVLKHIDEDLMAHRTTNTS